MKKVAEQFNNDVLLFYLEAAHIAMKDAEMFDEIASLTDTPDADAQQLRDALTDYLEDKSA